MTYLGENGNSALMKKLNLEKIFKTILLNRPISRAKISRLTGLNKVTVSNCVDYFLKLGVLKELGIESVGMTRGRPATSIDINGSAGICIGIEVDIHNFKIMVTDLQFHPLENVSLLLPNDPHVLIQIIANTIHELQERYNHYHLGVIGVGIALPGYYNVKTGVIEFIANLQNWNNFSFREKLNQLNLSVPFFIDNSVRVGAMGEIYFGKSSVHESLAYIGGSWGLGVGFCMHGHVFSGELGYAGRLGHSTIHMNGKKCSCGNKGCWEMYASVKAFYESLYPTESPDHAKLSEILERLGNHDPEVLLAINRLGYYQALGILNVANAYNPSSICIGGYLGLLGLPLIHSVRSTLADLLPDSFYKGIQVYCSELGELGVAYGGISMVKANLSNIFCLEKYYS